MSVNQDPLLWSLMQRLGELGVPIEELLIDGSTVTREGSRITITAARSVVRDEAGDLVLTDAAVPEIVTKPGGRIVLDFVRYERMEDA